MCGRVRRSQLIEIKPNLRPCRPWMHGVAPHMCGQAASHTVRRGSRGSLPRRSLTPAVLEQTAVLVIDLCPGQGLDGPGIVTFIREGVAAGLAEHVGMRLEL